VQKTIARLCIEHQVEPQWNDEMARSAIKWSHEKSKRCGRTALQFARHWLGQHMLEAEE
jgi:predicted AAA+ superfamily ATPase